MHGAIFTRGPDDLKHTALFVGGSDVARGEQVLAGDRGFVHRSLANLGNDGSGGANTTAAAAVLAAAKHLDLASAEALVLAATGPVGQRVAWLLAQEGASVTSPRVGKTVLRKLPRAIREKTDSRRFTAWGKKRAEELDQALAGVTLVVAAGAAGVELLTQAATPSAQGVVRGDRSRCRAPLGNRGREGHRQGGERHAVIYGAIGVGGTKMKIHKAAVKALFAANDRVLDAPEIFQIGREL